MKMRYKCSQGGCSSSHCAVINERGESDLQFGEISFLLSKEGQFEAIRENILNFPWLPIYPQLYGLPP
jgi:hypothetical protein